MDLDLNKLKVFNVVAKTGSFSKAAFHLKKPKSRVSRIISDLERELGTQLIHRTTRKFQLTTAGKELHQRTSPLLNEIHHTLEDVSTESDEISGLIKITVPIDIGSELLPKISQEFMEAYPKIRIVIHASNSIVDLIQESIDISIRITRAKDSSMIQRKLGHVDTTFVASPEFYHKYQPKTLDHLESMPYLTYETKDLKVRSTKITNRSSTKNLKLSPKLGSNNYFVLRAMVLQGMGFAMLPRFLAMDSVQRGELVHLFKDWKSEDMPIQILIPGQKEVPKKISKFISFLSPRLMPYFS